VRKALGCELSQILEHANHLAVYAGRIKDGTLVLMAQAVAYDAAKRLGIPDIAINLMQQDISERIDATRSAHKRRARSRLPGKESAPGISGGMARAAEEGVLIPRGGAHSQRRGSHHVASVPERAP